MRNLVKKHFNNIIVLDGGFLNFKNASDYSLYYKRIQDSHLKDLCDKVTIIVNMKGFYRGNTKSDGKWMLDEDVIRILEENPEWLETNVIAQDYGI